jgi:hypothetical protein
MAGEAKTQDMLLSSGTLMVGPLASLYSLNPIEHSLGLVKNIQIQTDMAFTDLTQGTNNQIVMSVQTKLDTKITAEVFEFTAANLAYGAGLDGSLTTSLSSQYALSASITGAGATFTTASTPTDITAGAVVVLQDTAHPDNIHVGRVLSVSADVVTLTSQSAFLTGANFPVATTVVYAVNEIKVGSVTTQPMFACKIVGILPATGEPVTLLFPKVKIVKALSMAFETNNFTNMPFEFMPYVQVASDPLYADFGNKYYSVLKR